MTATEDDRLARVALGWLAEPGTWSVYRLVRHVGAVAALAQLLDGGGPDQNLRAMVAARLAGGDPRAVAAQALEQTERVGARIVTPDDDEWPRQVADLRRLALPSTGRRVDLETAPPLCCWVRGSWPLAEALARSVAVVGARAATAYGVHVATGLGYDLADRGWTVVSGGAFGIDAAAHRGALNAGGLTVAVLACGIDRPYPVGNTALFDRIGETGLLVSEWMPGAEPLRPRFLVRNRLIAAATAGTVLVEASARSGATQTMRRALAIDRPAMVVPGPVTSAMSVGAHELMRDDPKARLVTGVAHVLEEVGRIGADLAPPVRGPVRPHDALDDEATMVLESLPRRGVAGPDTLAARAGLDVRTALRKLSMLEQLGLLVRRDGGYALPPPPPSPPSQATRVRRPASRAPQSRLAHSSIPPATSASALPAAPPAASAPTIAPAPAAATAIPAAPASADASAPPAAPASADASAPPAG